MFTERWKTWHKCAFTNGLNKTTLDGWIYVSYPFPIQITVEDYEQAAKSLFKALLIREKYSKLAYHRFCRTTAQFLRSAENVKWSEEDEVLPGMKCTHVMVIDTLTDVCSGSYDSNRTMLWPPDMCPCPTKGEDPYSMENIPENLNYELKMKDGIVYVYDNAQALRENQPNDLPYPDLETFAIDLSHVLAMIADGPT